MIIISFLIKLCFTARSLKSLHNFESPRNTYKLQFFCSEYEKCKYDRTKTSLHCNACKNQISKQDFKILCCRATSYNIKSSLWSQDDGKLHEKIAVKELIQNAILSFSNNFSNIFEITTFLINLMIACPLWQSETNSIVCFVKTTLKLQNSYFAIKVKILEKYMFRSSAFRIVSCSRPATYYEQLFQIYFLPIVFAIEQ